MGATSGRWKNQELFMPDEPIIDLQSDHFFMGEALRQAAKAYAAEEVPVGAVVVREGRIIARAFNQVELLKDATAHAEMLALTQAEAAVGDWRLTDCTLYVTKEPCPMCAGAIVHVRLARAVFGASDPKAGAAGSALNLLAVPDVESSLRDYRRRARAGMPRPPTSIFRRPAQRQRITLARPSDLSLRRRAKPWRPGGHGQFRAPADRAPVCHPRGIGNDDVHASTGPE